MRILGRVLFFFVILIAAMAAIGLLLPRQVSVARSITVNAPPEAVFPYVNNVKKFVEWSPWSARDPKAQYDFPGSEEGVGASMSWQSEKFGAGSMEITESQPPSHVATAFDFGGAGWANAAFDLAPEAGNTKVTWRFETDFGVNPVKRWVGLMFDKWIGEDYEEGLKRLKEKVEKS